MPWHLASSALPLKTSPLVPASPSSSVRINSAQDSSVERVERVCVPMEKKLYEAAKEGKVTSLMSLLQEDELILDRCMITSSFRDTTPLHVAAMLGHAEFSFELLRRKPELAGELDSRRSSALHLASARGYTEIVKALANINPQMCFVCDTEGRNPLHIAAIRGNVDVLKELVEAQPDAARARADRGETILHLCVQYFQVEALKLLMTGWENNGIH